MSWRNLAKDARIYSASLRTAFDWSGEILRRIPSAASRMSIFRSSLPFPSEFATEFI